MSGFSPEFRLLAACCRWPEDEARAAAITAAAAGPLDWQQFERLALRHRVVPLAARGIRGRDGVPAEVAARLAARASAEAVQGLALAAETLRLQGLFNAAGLPLTVAKGVPLALLAYGNVGLKTSRDIDLLTERACMLPAARLLEANGYRSLVGDEGVLTEAGLEHALAFEKDVSFVHRENGHIVELHFALARVAQLLPSLADHIPTQDVRLGARPIRTLESGAYYAYLCLHGIRHTWGRLKWLTDVNALLRSGAGDVAALHARATAEGIPRLSLVALSLAHEVFGLEVPPVLLAEARRSLPVRIMVASARRSLREWDGSDQWSERSMIRQRLNQLLYLEDAAYVRSMLRMIWADDPDLRGLHPPAGRALGYHLLRVPSWIWRMSRRALSRKLGRRGK